MRICLGHIDSAERSSRRRLLRMTGWGEALAKSGKPKRYEYSSGHPVMLTYAGEQHPLTQMNDIQQAILEESQALNVSGASSATVGGTISQPEASNGDSTERYCPCMGHCIPCDDPGIYKACRLHEDVHCEYEKNVCEKVGQQHTAAGEQLARNQYYSDIPELINNEVEAYNTSINELQRIVDSGECY